jgi:hypothetical protein
MEAEKENGRWTKKRTLENECNRLSDKTTTHPSKVELKRENPKKKTSAKKRVSQEYPKGSTTSNVQYYDSMQHGLSLSGRCGKGGARQGRS